MYCSNCGKQIDADSKFCENCGFKLEDAAVEKNCDVPEPPKEYSPKKQTSNDRPDPTNRKKLSIILPIAGFLVTVFIIVFISFGISMKRSSNYDRGIELFNKNDYSSAAACFSDLADKSYLNSQTWENESWYRLAIEEFNNKSYDMALIHIPDESYKNSQEWKNHIIIVYGKNLESTGEYTAALEIYKQFSGNSSYVTTKLAELDEKIKAQAEEQQKSELAEYSQLNYTEVVRHTDSYIGEKILLIATVSFINQNEDYFCTYSPDYVINYRNAQKSGNITDGEYVRIYGKVSGWNDVHAVPEINAEIIEYVYGE